MSDVNLPEGWALTRIIDIADVNPKKIDAEPEALSGFVPMSHAPTDFNGVLRFDEKLWGDIKKSYTNFKDNDVIVAKVTPCFENGKAAIVRGLPNGIGAGSSEFYVIRPAITEVSTRFLFSIVKSYNFLQEGASNMTGAVGLRRVPRAFVENFPVSLPPLAEQKVIADKLDTLLAQVETTKARLERIPEILKNFRQSVLAAAVSGKLTEDWRKGQRFGDLKEVGELALDIRYGTSKKCSEDVGKTAVLRIPNIGDGFVITENLKFADFAEKELEKLKLKVGDILIIRSNGSVELVGKLAVVSEADLNYLYAGYLIRLRLNKSAIDPDFAGYCLRSPDLRASIESVARSTSGVNNINSKELARLKLPLPTLAEQTKIVSSVEELFAFADRIEQKATDALARVNSLTQSILAKAFCGELSADWRAANSELIRGVNSAEALLEKIKVEREAMKPKKTTRARKKA